MQKDFGIVILAAGLGTRMKSRQAKVLHRAGGKTLIELVAATATTLVPADQVWLVVGHQGDLVQKVFEGCRVQFLSQAEQLGTGHAVLIGRDALQSFSPNLMVLYGDCPLVASTTLSGLMEQHLASGAAATVLTTRLIDPTGYGRILRDSDGRIQAIVEEKAASSEQKAITEINSGIYCFETRPLFDCLARIRPDNPAGEYYLTDVIGCLVALGLPVGGFSIIESWQVLGINTRVELAEVDALLRTRKVRDLMLAGVTIQRPETVTIDADVSIGADTVLEPFVQVLGRSSIGGDCLIRSYSVISDSVLSSDVIVEPFCWINESKVSSGAHIGPYARLRTGNEVGAGARIGNFVELKKTRLGARSKAMHLAYLGDSTIGADVNIGAGTITCNFDGQSKNPTVIHDGAFVGSNTTLVAPIEIGDGAYLAAGSVLTENVPDESLGIGRSRQTNKPGWAARRKKKQLSSAD
jgi:bifunctional UDP-N-acetylglucosamine pyrophosphorylase/glucosamine-1-phosphate N-acetyltransferase